MEVVTSSGPIVEADRVRFVVADPEGELGCVRLLQDLQRPRLGPDFVQRDDRWVLELRRPEIDRMEYLLQLTSAAGEERLIPDPANPLRAEGPFGDKSVIEWPGYEPPAWLASDFSRPGRIAEHFVEARPLRAALRLLLWSADGVNEEQPAPLLVAHDGPEYGEYSKLMMLLDAKTSSGELPPMRAALIAPVERDHIYSASAAYARALAHGVLPWLGGLAPTPGGRSMRVGMGASLGALAMLHTHRTYPASFGALFLQSGSFFRQRFDRQEAGFVRFRRISRFVGKVLAAPEWTHPIPIAMICGTVEENLINNHAMRAALNDQGYEARLDTHRDAHNWVAWRDTFDPHLVRLLQEVWA
ncbi:MAG: alpha/beta hydrolase [Actinomycetota bacterium]